MVTKVKYTKTERARQRKILKISKKMLPLFQAMEKLLMSTINTIGEDIERIREAIQRNELIAQEWVAVLADEWADIRTFITVSGVETKPVDIAGVRVEQFEKVDFAISPIEELTPLWVDDAIELMQDQLQLLAEIGCLKRQIELLEDELSETRARVKLFENKLIPEAEIAIRKITAKLQDDERLAIGTAKVMKTKKMEEVA